jgi:hypothetical protein
VSRTAKEFVTNIDGNGLQNTAIITDEDLAALGLAKLASPVFTGDPEAPTRAFGDSTNSIATTAFITNNTIRQRGALGTTVDLNSITEIGVHYQSTNSSAASGHNYPVAKAGVLTVSTAGSTAIVTQIYQEYNTGIIWSRSAFNGVWSIWSQLATIGQLNAIGYGITHQNTTANHEWVEFANGYISGNMAIDLPGSMATSGSHNVIFDKPLVSRCSGVQVSCVSDVGVVVTVGSLTNSGVTIYWHSPIPIGGSIKTYLSYTGF